MKISKVKLRKYENEIWDVIDDMLENHKNFDRGDKEYDEIIDNMYLYIDRLKDKLKELEEYVDSTEEIL